MRPDIPPMVSSSGNDVVAMHVAYELITSGRVLEAQICVDHPGDSRYDSLDRNKVFMQTRHELAAQELELIVGSFRIS